MLPPNSKIDFRADYAATFVTSNMSSRLKFFSPGTEPPENDDVGRGVLPESENENPFEQKFVSKALSKRKLAATGE